MGSKKLNNDKILVCYLITKFDNQETLENFIINYKKFNSGVDHDLLICFKQLNNLVIKRYHSLLKPIKYINFEDNYGSNDYDFGSYKRVAEKFSTKIIFFLNSHSYPVCNYWLKMISDYFHKNSLIATTASFESQLSSIRYKKFYKIINYFFKKYKFKKKFNSYPNPHLRTTGLLINAKDYLSFMKDKVVNSKHDAWELESGKIGLTNYFKFLGYNLYVVNSDGNKFEEKFWKFSETYNYLNQEKSIISDKHTRKYLSLGEKERKTLQIRTWGV